MLPLLQQSGPFQTCTLFTDMFYDTEPETGADKDFHVLPSARICFRRARMSEELIPPPALATWVTVGVHMRNGS